MDGEWELYIKRLSCVGEAGMVKGWGRGLAALVRRGVGRALGHTTRKRTKQSDP